MSCFCWVVFGYKWLYAVDNLIFSTNIGHKKVSDTLSNQYKI